MVPAYAIKSIVLIDFTRGCQDGTCRSIPAAETTPAKPRVLGNLRESPPVRRTRMCASACSLRNQPCAGAESRLVSQKRCEMLKSNSVAAVMGTRSRGDDVIAMSRAFMYAGSPSVIASLWSVDDEATEQLMVAFYNTPERGLEQSGSSAPRPNGRPAEVPPSLLPGGVCFDGQSRPDWQFQSSSQFGEIALMAPKTT